MLKEYMSAEETETKKVCAECGSGNVEHMVWADVNTDKVRGEVTEPSPYCRACDQNVTLTDVPVTRYHIVELDTGHAEIPVDWLKDCDLGPHADPVRSDLTWEEAIEWEGPRPAHVTTGAWCPPIAVVLDHKTPDDLRDHMKAGDIGSLHTIVSLINDADREGYLKDGVVARLLGGDA